MRRLMVCWLSLSFSIQVWGCLAGIPAEALGKDTRFAGIEQCIEGVLPPWRRWCYTINLVAGGFLSLAELAINWEGRPKAERAAKGSGWRRNQSSSWGLLNLESSGRFGVCEQRRQKLQVNKKGIIDSASGELVEVRSYIKLNIWSRLDDMIYGCWKLCRIQARGG